MRHSMAGRWYPLSGGRGLLVDPDVIPPSTVKQPDNKSKPGGLLVREVLLGTMTKRHHRLVGPYDLLRTNGRVAFHDSNGVEGNADQ